MQQFPKAEEHFDTAIELEPQNPVHRVYKGSVSSRSSTLYLDHNYDSGGALASWLVRTTPDRVVWVRALAGVIAWGKTLYSHSASLHPGVQMGTSKCAGGNPAMD